MRASSSARWPSLFGILAIAILLSSSTGVIGQQDTVFDRLAEELRARNDPGFWGDTTGPLVRDRLLSVSEAAAREHAQWSADFLTRVNAIDPATLTHDDWITWSLLRWEGEVATAARDFYWHQPPIAPYSSALRTVTTSFTAASLASVDDRRRYLDGLHQLPVLLAQIETKLRGQVVRGIVLPAAQVDAVVPLIRSFASQPDASQFGVRGTRLDTIPPDARGAFKSAVDEAIANLVNPAFERLAAYVERPYRRRAPTEVGVGQYPDGERYYRFLVRQHTGLELTPEQIHQIGLDEVARLENELDEVRRQAGFAGPLEEFRTFLKTDRRFFPSTPEQIGEALMQAANRIEPALRRVVHGTAEGAVRRPPPGARPGTGHDVRLLPTADTTT